MGDEEADKSGRLPRGVEPALWAGDGTVTANPAGRFYLKAHTHFFSQAYVQ